MRKPAVFVIAMAGMLVTCLMLSNAVAAAKRAAGTATPKAESYSVVQIGDEMSVVKKSELVKLRKDVAQKYKEDMKQYKAAMKEAAKSKDKGADKAPEKPIQSKIVVKKTFKSEDEAKTWLANHVDAKQDQPKTGSKAEAKTDKKPAPQ